MRNPLTERRLNFKKNTCVSVSDGSLLPAVDVMRDELGTSYGLKLAEGTNCPITFTLDENLDVTGHVGSAQSITADEPTRSSPTPTRSPSRPAAPPRAYGRRRRCCS